MIYWVCGVASVEENVDIRGTDQRIHQGFWKAVQFALMLLLLMFNGAEGGIFEDNPSFDALEAAWKSWKDAAQCKGDYVLRKGSAPTKELALEGRFGSKIGEPKAEDRAIGFFAKLGSKIRYSYRPKRAVKGENSETLLRDDEITASFDEISTATLTLLSRQKKSGRLKAIVTPRPDSLAGKVVAGERMSLTFHPFSAGLKLDGTLRDFLAPRPGFGEEIVSSSIDKPDSDHIEIRVVKTFRDKASDTITFRLIFRTDVSPPVIERIESVSDLVSRDVKQEGVTLFEDFVRCNGTLMPRCIRRAFGPIVPVGKDKPVWLATEWQSANLGKVAPVDEDFVYVAPVDSAIVGLTAKVPIANGKYHLDLDDYTLEDFEFLPDGSLIAHDQPIAVEQLTDGFQRRTGRVVAVVCGLVLLLLVILVWVRRRREQQ